MRTPLLLLPLLLAACGDNRIIDCSKLAGPGWTRLNQAPPNANQLLELESLPADGQTLWMSKGPNKVLACYYDRGLTSPGCFDSKAYVFEQSNGRWRSKGALLDTCEADQQQ